MLFSRLSQPARRARMQPMHTRNPLSRLSPLAGLARLIGAALLLAALYGGFRAWLAPDNLLAWLSTLRFCG